MPKRIALITDAWLPQVNGVVRTLGKVRSELESVGRQVLIFHPGLFRTFPCPVYPEIRLSLLPGRVLRNALDDLPPDAIHIATEGPLGIAARRYCLRRGFPFTTSYHTKFPEYIEAMAGVPVGLTYGMLRWFHRPATRTLVPTESVKAELDARQFSDVRTWTRGVDTSVFQPYDKAFLDLPRPVFVYFGRVSVEKNIEAFLAADLPGTKLVIGDGPAMKTLTMAYPDVIFAGYRHGVDLARHIAASDVFVFPSRTDTYGVVMLEALACGVPVAAYPVTGPIDVIKDDRVGILDEDIANAAKAALDLDPAACRQYALRFSWQRCATMFYENLEPIVHDATRRDSAKAGVS